MGDLSQRFIEKEPERQTCTDRFRCTRMRLVYQSIQGIEMNAHNFSAPDQYVIMDHHSNLRPREQADPSYPGIRPIHQCQTSTASLENPRRVESGDGLVSTKRQLFLLRTIKYW